MTPAPDLTLTAAVLVATGAAVGGVARWVLGAYLSRDFPYGVMVANVAGSFLLGVLLFGPAVTGALGAEARLLLGVGALGAFTTMSTFAYDTIALVENGAYVRAGVNVLVNPVLALVAVWLGRAVALAWAPGA